MKRILTILILTGAAFVSLAQTIPPRLSYSLSALEELQRYRVNRKAAEQKDIYRHRPAYHFTSPENILHDPNGLCFCQGRWLMF